MTDTSNNSIENPKLFGVSKDKAGKIFLFLWIPIVALIFSFQMAGHLLTMPIPENIKDVERALSKIIEKESKHWTAIHVIYQNCSCANSLLTQLLKREPVAGTKEIILFVGDDRNIERQASTKGYIFQTLTASDLKEIYHIEAAPMLAILSPKQKLRYLGGYFERYGSYNSQDQSIFLGLMNGEAPTALPLFGCATSDRLREKFDPLSLKFD